MMRINLCLIIDYLFDNRLIVQYLDYYKRQPLLYPIELKETLSARLVVAIAEDCATQ